MQVFTLYNESSALRAQVGGSEAAVYDYARGGPQWGSDALVRSPPCLSDYLYGPHAGKLWDTLLAIGGLQACEQRLWGCHSERTVVGANVSQVMRYPSN